MNYLRKDIGAANANPQSYASEAEARERAHFLVGTTRNPSRWVVSVRDLRNGYSKNEFVWHIESPCGTSLWEDDRGFSAEADIVTDDLDIDQGSIEVASGRYASPQDAIDDLFDKVKVVALPFRAVMEELETMVSPGSGV